jgi:hypothetical protein
MESLRHCFVTAETKHWPGFATQAVQATMFPLLLEKRKKVEEKGKVKGKEFQPSSLAPLASQTQYWRGFQPLRSSEDDDLASENSGGMLHARHCIP